jgi:hypothetical protein
MHFIGMVAVTLVIVGIVEVHCLFLTIVKPHVILWMHTPF